MSSTMRVITRTIGIGVAAMLAITATATAAQRTGSRVAWLIMLPRHVLWGSTALSYPPWHAAQ